MNTNTSQNFWVFAGVIFFAGIVLLYNVNQYDALKMEIDREEAIKISTEFLKNLEVPVDNYEKEAFIDTKSNNHRVYLKALGNDRYKNFIESEELPVPRMGSISSSKPIQR